MLVIDWRGWRVEGDIFYQSYTDRGIIGV